MSDEFEELNDFDMSELVDGLEPEDALRVAASMVRAGRAARNGGAAPAVDADAINARAAEIAAESGVDISPDDPEWDSVRWRTKDPAAFLADWKKAHEAKAQRTTQTSLMRAYKKEVEKLHPGSEAVHQTRQKYRSKGLKI